MSVKKWMWTLGKSCHAIMPIRLHHPGLYIQRGESNILCAGGGIQCITVRPISDFTGSSQSCTNKKDCVTSQSATQSMAFSSTTSILTTHQAALLWLVV
ncbi:uncharacterized protein LOC108712980 isoform X3 [Xenopus laevis]|uniref:Uncharacterized protein LOC108712980 isoform X3 n=1 Tax=Xenopus laevis TaxID=8355 RepID=A0A8J1MRA5_XENLA|nr:uncharacterized protein LOC108712980 isoform X3 [Xenopus laevis]